MVDPALTRDGKTIAFGYDPNMAGSMHTALYAVATAAGAVPKLLCAPLSGGLATYFATGCAVTEAGVWFGCNPGIAGVCDTCPLAASSIEIPFRSRMVAVY